MISKYFTNIRTPSIRKGKAGHNLISKVWKNRFGKSSGPLHLERIVSRPHLGTNTLCCTSFPSSGPCRDTCVVPLCIHVVWTGSPIHSWRNGTSNWLWRSWLRCGDEQLTSSTSKGRIRYWMSWSRDWASSPMGMQWDWLECPQRKTDPDNKWPLGPIISRSGKQTLKAQLYFWCP